MALEEDPPILYTDVFAAVDVPTGHTETSTVTDPADFMWFNDRLAPGEQSADAGHESFSVPPDKVLVITDIVIQNRKPGDEPVDDAEFSRMAITGDPSGGTGADFILTVVGNRTLNLHFQTGIRVISTIFRIANILNSSAPFVEYQLSGYLAPRPPGLG